MTAPESDTHRAIEAVFRIESPRLIAGLARIVRDVGLAEELAQEALVVGARTVARDRRPRQPGRLADGDGEEPRDRRAPPRQACSSASTRSSAASWSDARDDAAAPSRTRIDDDIGDDLLRLIFTSCHPVLSTEARVALTLRLLGGLTTDEIARAFLVPEPTIAQRIVRAKRTLSEARVPFEVPRGAELARAARVGAGGDLPDLQRRLRRDRRRRLDAPGAVRGRASPRPHPRRAGAARSRGARPRRADGDPGVARSRARAARPASRSCCSIRIARAGTTSSSGAGWPRSTRAEALGGARGPYALQAAIAACHARARTPEETDWARIVALYGALAELTPSPIIELNRAVAVAMAQGRRPASRSSTRSRDEPALARYHLLPSVRGDFLMKLGRRDEARAEFERAASLTQNARERALLLDRAAACARANGKPDA